MPLLASNVATSSPLAESDYDLRCLLLVCGALGLNRRSGVLAAVVEFIHTALLCDVVDDSTLRRGHATANETFGNPASVLVGDFSYSRAFPE